MIHAYSYNNGTHPYPKEWSKNWGDAIAATIIKHFSGNENVVSTANSSINGKIVSVGSVMGHVRENDMVWGTGTIDKQVHFPYMGNPFFFAVRGPKTREILARVGHKVPDVYGDPALLYPQIYNPEVKTTHEWGIIPHYVDTHHPGVKSLVDKGVKFIDICAGENEFIDQLKSVKKVVSSSLHGLIAADAYGIPNARINLTGRLVGGDHKFIDYSESIGRELWQGTWIPAEYTIKQLNELPLNEINNFNESLLIESAPWNHSRFKSIF